MTGAGRSSAVPGPIARSARTSGLGDPRQACRHDLDPCRRGGEARLQRQEGGARRHPRSAGLGHPAHRAGRGDQDGAVRHGRPQGLPLHRLLGCRDRHRRRGRAAGGHQRCAARAGGGGGGAARLRRRHRAGAAALLRHQDPGRARLRPRPRRRDSRTRRPPGADRPAGGGRPRERPDRHRGGVRQGYLCPALAATSAGCSAATDTSRRCAGPGSAPSPRPRPARWQTLTDQGPEAALPICAPWRRPSTRSPASPSPATWACA